MQSETGKTIRLDFWENASHLVLMHVKHFHEHNS